MVMNKKGFLKILEAIVAVLIVFGFVIAIIPSKSVSQPKLPPNLEQTTNSILQEVQEEAGFRSCILGGESNLEGISGTGAECVYRYIDYITQPKPLHAWDYGVRVCSIQDQDLASQVCEYYGQDTENAPVDRGNINIREGPISSITREDLRDNLPEDRNVYIRTISLSVQDVLGSGETAGTSRDISQAGTTHLVTVFAWSKSK